MEIKRMNDLKERLLASLITVPLVFTSVFLAQNSPFKILFVVVLSLFSALALKEMYAMENAKGLSPNSKISIFFSVAYIAAILYSQETSSLFAESLLLLYPFLVFLIYFKKGDEPILNLAGTFFGFLYVTIPLSYIASIITINEPLQDGRLWVLYLLSVVKATDTAGFFIGRNFGKTPFAPMISPKKTWEGAFAGFLGAIAMSLLFSFIPKVFPEARFTLSPLLSIFLGAFISIAAQAGDLSESLMKRDAKVKDSSSLPGLGGVLDIVDSVVFAAPLLYIVLKSGAI